MHKIWHLFLLLNTKQTGCSLISQYKYKHVSPSFALITSHRHKRDSLVPQSVILKYETNVRRNSMKWVDQGTCKRRVLSRAFRFHPYFVRHEAITQVDRWHCLIYALLPLSPISTSLWLERNFPWRRVRLVWKYHPKRLSTLQTFRQSSRT